MRISDWSSDVCSSDLDGGAGRGARQRQHRPGHGAEHEAERGGHGDIRRQGELGIEIGSASCRERVCQYVSISVVGVSLTKKKANADRETERSREDYSRSCALTS